MTRDEVIEILAADNPRALRGNIVMYATAFAEWQQAAANIEQHGTIVAHPRTAAPIENPYLRVRAAAMATMAKAHVRVTDRLWKLAAGAIVGSVAG